MDSVNSSPVVDPTTAVVDVSNPAQTSLGNTPLASADLTSTFSEISDSYVTPSAQRMLDFADDLLSPEYETPPQHGFPSSGAAPRVDNSVQAFGGAAYPMVNRSLENILLDGAGMDESIDLGAFESSSAGPSLGVESDRDADDIIQEIDNEILHEGSGTTKIGIVDQVTIMPGSDDVDEGKLAALQQTEAPCDETKQDFTLMGQHIGSEIKEEAGAPEISAIAAHEKPIESHYAMKIITEEAVEVGFSVGEATEANKSTLVSSTLPPVDSTRSLVKFFASDAATGGTDVEGRNFFDSFSTGNELEQAPVADRRMSESAAGTGDVVDSRPDYSGSLEAGPSSIAQGSSPRAVMMPGPFSASAQPQAPMFQFHDPKPEFDWQPSLSPALVASATPESLPGGAIAVSDEDEMRRRDAWLPSEATGRVLVQAFGGPAGMAGPLSPTQLCRPGVVTTEMLGDPVYELLLRSMGEQEANKRLVLNVDSVPQDDVGLRQLIKSECLRSAVDLTCRLLAVQCGQGPGKVNQISTHTPYSLQLWFTRLSLMVKLRLCTQAETELEPFGNLDTPDLFYEFHQDTFPLRRGSMVPFSMRLLHAELPQFCGRLQETLDRLYYLLAVVDKILSNLGNGLSEDGSMTLAEASRTASKELWKSRRIRTLYSIGNCFIGAKDYGASIEIYKSLLLQDEPSRMDLYNGLARIHIQMGDIATAARYFSLAEELSDLTTDAAKCQKLINLGLLALGSNSFVEAHRLFQEAVVIDPGNVMAVNNMAVCLLYLGRLASALQSLETLVYADPQRCLQETTVLNLCTLYELESSKAQRKKQQLLSLISQHRGNGFNVVCLKMN